jgi:hypothetical protein
MDSVNNPTSLPARDFSPSSLRKILDELPTSGKIYSGIGQDVLVCCDAEDARFREVHSEGYVNKLKDDHEKSGHPYFFLHDAYRILLETHQHQSVIFR